MSKLYSASQYDDGFKARRLANWEQLDQKAKAPARPAARSGATAFVADERGHLLPGQPKRAAAFAGEEVPVHAHAPARWPEPNATYSTGGEGKGFGYKGIQTSYLPTSTVPLKTVVVPGSKEATFH